MKIAEYILPYNVEIKIDMPKGAHVFTVQSVADQISLIAIVDPDQPFVTRNFEAYGVGDDIPDGARNYIGTAALQYHRNLIFHIFELL